MSVPARRRPGAASPIQTLVPHVEEVRTSPTTDGSSAPILSAVPPVQEQIQAPASTTSAVAFPAAPPSTPETVAPVAAAPLPTPAATVQQPAATPRPIVDADEKKATTLAIRRSIKARAETAVLWTSGQDGGYKSWAAFVEGALEHELQRLEREFNGGVQFPPNTGSFRQGRPAGT